MLRLLMLLHLLTGIELIYVRQPIQFQLDAKEMMSSLKSVLNSKFIQEVAHNIATNAVEQFMHQINQSQAFKNRIASDTGDLPQIQVKHAEQSSVSVTSKSYYIPARPRLSSRFDRLTEEFKRIRPHRQPVNPSARPKEKKVFDQHIAYTLLQTPAPDGDSLELDSIDFTTTIKPVLKKINGRYMRRFLDYFSYSVSIDSEVEI